jgi:ribonuclease D
VSAEPVLALDLEADSLHHYPEKICLVQLPRRQTTILDPLAAPEVLADGLEPVLADPAVRKTCMGATMTRLLKRERVRCATSTR